MKKIRVACCGDSITFGHGIKDKNNTYPSVLQELLGIQYEVRNYGTNHATVFKRGSKPYWNMKAYEDSKLFLPDIVVIMLGTNCSNKTNWRNKETFVTDYLGLVEVYRKLPSKPKVIVCRHAPALKLKFGINPEIIQNEQLPLIDQMVEKDHNLISCDVNSALLEAEDCFSDQIHPNETGARLIAEVIEKVIKLHTTTPKLD